MRDYLGLAAVFGAMIWLLSLCHCSAEPISPSPHPGCVGACEQGAAIGCEWAAPSPEGIPCVDWCTRYHDLGYMRPWADCVARAGDPGAVVACGVGCER